MLNFLRPTNKKSGKRETALALLIFWMGLTFHLWFFVDDESVAEYEAIYSTITAAIFVFVGGAFGLHAYLTQSKKPDDDTAPD